MDTKIALPVEAIRRESLAAAKDLGFPINESLPLLGDSASTRTADEIVDRLLCLNAVAMCACGFDRARAHAWLSRENLVDKLTALERHFIGEDTGKGDLFLSEIESIWALLWALGMATHLNVTIGCGSFLSTRVPNAATGENSRQFRTWVRPRSTSEIAAAGDLTICAQWGFRQAALSYPKKVWDWLSPDEIEARRRALEWLLGDRPWQEGPLDTSFGGDMTAHLPPPETDGASAEPATFRESIRRQSLKTASNLGYPINPGLPFIALENPKSKDKAVSRLLCLFALAERALGIGLRRVRAWLKSEGLSKDLTRDERAFLEFSDGNAHQFVLYNMESVWTLAWALGLVEELDFGKDCGDDLTDLLPDIKKDESSAALRAKAALRPWEEILAACDLADCIHWGIRETNMKGWKQSGKVHPYAITERRRALNWLICDEAWNVISLDT
jgi:Domain of unknown function (DUF4272)